MKKEIPLLFSSEMVSAILDGRKVMTRRAVKGLTTEQNSHNHNRINFDFRKGKELAVAGINIEPGDLNNDFTGITGYCPYGKPGDILWVKETFTILDYWEDSKAVHVMYEDSKTRVCDLTDDEWNKFIKWQNKMERKPSLFMFKSLSRIWLEVTEERVERLQEITEEDAEREGVEKAYYTPEPFGEKKQIWKSYYESDLAETAKASFFTLWQSINGPESWNANPFVWCVSFKVLSTTGKPEIN